MAAFAAFVWIAGAQDRGAVEFEAASVKPAPVPTGPGGGGGGRAGRGMRMSGGPGTSDPGRFSAQMPLKFLVTRAYGVDADQVEAPEWMTAAQYIVEAKIPAGATVEQFRGMLQKLLADRFQMTVHRETRAADGYDLVVAKGGPKFKEAASTDNLRGGGSFGRNGATLTFGKMPLSAFVSALNQRVREQNGTGTIVRVTDKTGLTGLYNFELHYDADEDIFRAIQSQLGLRLEPHKIQIEVIVVDKAEKVPREN